MLSMVYLGGSLLAAYGALVFNRRLFALLIVAICLLSNFASLCIYYIAPGLSSVSAAVAARELAVYSCFALSLLLVRGLRWPIGTTLDKIFLLLFVFVVCSIIASVPRTGVSALLMGRELIFPLATFFLFRFLNLDERSLRLMLGLVVGVAVAGATLAIVEQFYVNLVNPSFWEQVAVSGYLAQKYGSFDGSFPLSWVNYLPVFIGRDPMMRSIGPMLDPLASGHFLACSLPIAFYWTKGWKRYLLSAVIIAGALCTFSKATMLIIFVIIGTQALRLRSPTLRGALLAAMIVCVLLVGALLLSTGDDRFTHFGSFKTGVNALLGPPFGQGVGSTGYFTFLVTGGGTLDAVDTTFSVYVYQMGLPGFLALALLAFSPPLVLLYHLHLLRANGLFVANTASRLLLTAVPLFLIYGLLAFASAAAYNAVAIFLPMLLLGSYCSAWVQLRAELRSRAVAPATLGHHF
jgi:hypothetical protein